MGKIKKVCPICGKEFQIDSSDHRLKAGKTVTCSRKCGGKMIQKGRIVCCPVCGKDFYTTRNKTCSVECGIIYKSRNTIHKTYSENGYLVEYQNGYNKKGNVKQHRRIIEEVIGRKLLSNEVVHHKNGIKIDNRIENLEVMKRSEHSSMHRKAEKAAGKHLFGGYHNN